MVRCGGEWLGVVGWVWYGWVRVNGCVFWGSVGGEGGAAKVSRCGELWGGEGCDGGGGLVGVVEWHVFKFGPRPTIGRHCHSVLLCCLLHSACKAVPVWVAHMVEANPIDLTYRACTAWLPVGTCANVQSWLSQR